MKLARFSAPQYPFENFGKHKCFEQGPLVVSDLWRFVREQGLEVMCPHFSRHLSNYRCFSFLASSIPDRSSVQPGFQGLRVEFRHFLRYLRTRFL